MKKFTVHKNLSLKDFTDEVYPQGSFVFSALLRGKDIKVNGARVSENVQVSAGDEVVYYTTAAQESAKSHEVIYKDVNFLICDKKDGVSAEALSYELSQNGYCCPAHRLDRNTKGVMAFALNEGALNALLCAFSSRKVQKVYYALCKNKFPAAEKKLTAYLKKDNKSATVQISDAPKKGYTEIETEYKVVKAEGDVTLVKVTLHTGKTHQIRAHLAHIGCPVLGDEKYGDRAFNKKYGFRRQCLVAKTLKFSLGGEYSYLNGKTFTSNFELSLPD